MNKIKKMLSVMKTVLMAAFIMMIIIFTANYGFTNWENVAAKFVETAEEISNSITCEIDYKDFHYEGFCADREDILEFLDNRSNEIYCNNQISNKNKIIEDYKDALNITLHNLDECRDIQIDCINDCFGEVPRVNRRW